MKKRRNKLEAVLPGEGARPAPPPTEGAAPPVQGAAPGSDTQSAPAPPTEGPAPDDRPDILPLTVPAGEGKEAPAAPPLTPIEPARGAIPPPRSESTPPSARPLPEGLEPVDLPAALASLPSEAPPDLAPLSGTLPAQQPPPPQAVPLGPPSSYELTVAPLATVLPGPPGDLVQALEQRVRRLEDTLAQVQDLHGLETRVAERVADKVSRNPGASSAQAGGGLSPLTTASAVLDAGQRILGLVDPPRQTESGVRRSWMAETLAELRAMLRMYTDPRYRLSWVGRIVPLVLLAGFVASDYLVPLSSLPLVGWLVRKAGELVLLYALFRVLGYEARRYRETAPDLPPNLRL